MSMGPGGGGFYSGSHGYYDDRDQGYDSRRGGRSRGYPNEEHSPDAQRMFMELFPQILGEIVQKNSGQQQMLQQQMLQQQMYDHQIYQQQACQQGLHAQHMYESANRRREAYVHIPYPHAITYIRATILTCD